MRQDGARSWWVSLLVAGAMALLASLGGEWGSALGQTAGPPPTRPPAGATVVPVVVTPPAATEYRPAPVTTAPEKGAGGMATATPSADTRTVLPVPTAPVPAASVGPAPSPAGTAAGRLEPTAVPSVATRPSSAAAPTLPASAPTAATPPQGAADGVAGEGNSPLVPLLVAGMAAAGVAAVGVWRLRR